MGMHSTGKFRFDPDPDDRLTPQEIGAVLRLLLDQHIFDEDEIEKLPLEVRAYFKECLPDEFE